MNANGLFIIFSVVVIIFVGIIIIISAKKSSQNPKTNPKADSAQNVGIFANFTYTDEEWKYVQQKEFVEDERGKGFFDKYSGVILYDKITRENTGREIFFTPQEIYLTDGKKGKSFTVNRLNSSGNGFGLSSIGLLHLTPLKKLRIKVSGYGIHPESNELDFDLEYLVPIPQSSLVKIDEILKFYGDIILNA